MQISNSNQEEVKKERKRRSDKGLIMATRRDQYCLAWISEMYAARLDQVQRLLSKFPDPEKPFKDGDLIGETTVRDMIRRWERAGWIEYRRILADSPGWVWATKKGLALVGLDDIYTARVPASTRLDHIYAVNQTRLGLDDKYTWKSERRYRSEELKKQKAKKGAALGPIPDGLITTVKGVVALEVEISTKKRGELEAKIDRLLRHYVPSPDEGLKYVAAFPTIWFYTPNQEIETLVKSACETLKPDDRKRVGVAIQKELRPSKFR